MKVLDLEISGLERTLFKHNYKNNPNPTLASKYIVSPQCGVHINSSKTSNNNCNLLKNMSFPQAHLMA